MGGDAFAQSWIARAGDSLQTSHEIDILFILWKVEWAPCELGSRNVNALVCGEEVALSLLVVRQVGLEFKSVVSIAGMYTSVD